MSSVARLGDGDYGHMIMSHSDVKTILIFSWYYLPYVGGAELFVHEIIARLSHRFRFVIVTARGDRALARRDVEDGAEVIRVGLGVAADKIGYPLPALWRSLAIANVDLVHAIMVNAAALTAYLYCKLRSTPSMLTLQNGDSEEYVRDYLGPFFPMFPRLHRPFDRIHAISRHLREQAMEYGADGSRITVIPNGVDTELFSRSAPRNDEQKAHRLELGLENRRVIVSASRLALKNGMEDLLRALPAIFAEHPDAVLLLLGDGEDRVRLQSLARELRVDDRVRFVGSVGHSEVPSYLSLADVFVRPSVSEGLGTAFLEALACEVPIVGTPVGGIPDFLVPEKTGLFCEPGEPSTIAAAVSRFLSDPTLARGCAARGRAMVEREYRWDTVAARVGDLYDELLERREGDEAAAGRPA